MPSIYAHYRFGARLLPTLPRDVQLTIKRYRRLFDVGLHGPDLFYYYNPLVKTAIGDLGNKFHAQTGAEFFGRVCRMLVLSPSDPGMAYLYGVLAHYCLDSVCHPFVNAQVEARTAPHVDLESEFERYLLTLDDKVPVGEQDLSLHIQLTPGEAETVAEFYKPAKARHIAAGVKNMALLTKLLILPEGNRRKALTQAMKLASPDNLGMILPLQPDPRCAHLDGEFMELYTKAEQAFPELLRQVQEHMSHNVPFGSEFSVNFG